MTRTRRAARVGSLTLVIALVWAGGVAITLLLARGNLAAAEQHIDAGQGALSAIDVTTAAGEFEHAAHRSAIGHRQLRWPHVRLTTAIPRVGDSVVVATRIAGAAADVSAAARDVAGTILDLPDGAESLTPHDGTLPVDAMGEIAPALRELEHALARAVEMTATATHRPVAAPVADARDRFLGLAEPAHRRAEIAAHLAEQLPTFLGVDRPRRYFLGAANPAELRGAGGFIGAFAVMTFDGGQLDIGPWSEIHDLANVPAEAVAPPNRDYAARYDQFGGAGHWMNINMTPDFPSAATAMERLWNDVTGEPIDGVVLVDPFAFQALLEVAGPVDVRGTRITADNVVAYVSNEAYDEFPSASERKDVIGQVAAAALEGFLESPDPGDLHDALDPLSTVVRGGHLLVHAVDPEVQAALAAAGVDGRLPDPDGDHLGVFVNNAAAAKQDFFVDRSIEYVVRLLPGGRVSGDLELTFANHTPSEGPSRHIIGPAEGREPGQMHGLVSVFCAPRCDYAEAPDDHRGPARVSTELGLAVVDTWVTVDSGAHERLRYAWTTADAWETRDGVLVYRLSFNDQVTIRPTALRVQVVVPEGFVAHGLPDGAVVEDGAVVWERTDERGDTELTVELVPTDQVDGVERATRTTRSASVAP